MITQKEESLQTALQKCGLRELPKAIKLEDTRMCMSAIMLTKRVNGTEAYVYAENDGNGNLSIVADYGPCVAIYSIESIHPVKMLDKKIMPDLRSDKQIIEYLCKSAYDRSEIEPLLSKEGKTAEQIKADRETVRQYIGKVAVGFAKRQQAEAERVDEIKNYKSRISHE